MYLSADYTRRAVIQECGDDRHVLVATGSGLDPESDSYEVSNSVVFSNVCCHIPLAY